MASGESKPYLKESRIRKHSDDDSGSPYYVNATTKECTWSHPNQFCSGDGGIDSHVQKGEKIVDKVSSSESVYVLPSGGSKIDSLECPKKNRLCPTGSATVQGNATDEKGVVTAKKRFANFNSGFVSKEKATTSHQKSVNLNKEKDDKNEVKENIETKIKKELDDENIKTYNEPKAVELCDMERKPISFSLKTKKLSLIDDTNQLAETSKPKPAVHPSILSFKKLAKTVKWSTSNKKKQQAQNRMTSPLTEKVKDNLGQEKKQKNLETLRNIIKTPQVFRRPKKGTNKPVVKTVKAFVDFSYHSDEENSTRSDKPQHVQEPSVAELVRIPAKVVSPISPKQHKRQLKSTMKTETPTDVGHFVGYNKDQNKHLTKKYTPYSKHVESKYTNNRFCGKKTRDEDKNIYAKEVSQLDKVSDNNKYDKEVSQFDEVTDMEVDVQEIMDEIASFRGNLGHSCNSEISRLSKDYDRDFKSVYYVTDTNVLLHDIGFLDDLKTREINGRSIIIVIPYAVLQELDGLKKSRNSIAHASYKAIAWCNRHFEGYDKRVVGQIYEDYLQTVSENPRNSADDLIRDCCLLMKKQGLEVVLLTNDTNLRNKALSSKINAMGAKKLHRTLGAQSRMVRYNPQPVRKDDCKPAEASSYPEMMNKETVPNPCTVLESKTKSVYDLQKDKKVFLEKIKTSLHMTLGRVLEASFKDSYGEDLWLKIILHKPPWTLEQVFTCWDKHWLAVFIDKFKPEVRNLVGKIKDCLNYTNTKEDLETLEKKVSVLYKFFENLQFKNCVLPLNLDTLEQQGSDSLVPEQVSQKTVFSGGLTNAKKMIDLVGAHITYVLAMICEAFQVPHSLDCLKVGQMSREEAASSARNLHDFIMKLGSAIVSCLSSATSVSLRELGNLLVGFWNKANKPCPDLPFREEDLCILATSPDGQKYLQLVAGELERLLTMLKSIMNM